jgi:hypothetical protein
MPIFASVFPALDEAGLPFLVIGGHPRPVLSFAVTW